MCMRLRKRVAKKKRNKSKNKPTTKTKMTEMIYSGVLELYVSRSSGPEREKEDKPV